MEMPKLVLGNYCYWINETQDPEEHGGFVPSIVVRDESGHFPLKGKPPCAAPWVWGKTLDEAKKVASRINYKDLGLTPEAVDEIVASSMKAQTETHRCEDCRAEGASDDWECWEGTFLCLECYEARVARMKRVPPEWL